MLREIVYFDLYGENLSGAYYRAKTGLLKRTALYSYRTPDTNLPPKGKLE